MRTTHKALLVGAALLLGAGAGAAASHNSHVLTVALPDGGVAHIRYSGDVPPTLTIAPAEQVPGADWDADVQAPALTDAPTAFAFDAAPFAAMDRMMAAMDRQIATALHQAALTERSPRTGAAPETAPGFVAFGPLPAGAGVHSQFVSTTIGPDGCTRSVRWTSDGTDAQPTVIRTHSGPCATGQAAHGAGKAAPKAVASPPAPATSPAPSPVPGATAHRT